MDTDTTTVFPLHSPGTNLPAIKRKKTAQGICVVPTEQVSPLLVLPNELLVEIASYLTFTEFCRLAITSRRLTTIFNTEAKLKKLADQYYGSASAAYRKIIANRNIPAVPGKDIKVPLLRLAYQRRVSNNFLKRNTLLVPVVTLNGHAGRVISVMAFADGRLASSGGDSTVRVWDLGKPDGERCVATLKGHTDWVTSVAVLADGRLASSSEDGTVKVWNLSLPDGQQCVATLNGHYRWTKCVTEMPDGRLASCSLDHTIKVWDLSKPAGQECVATLFEEEAVDSVASLSDGQLVSCSEDTAFRVWDLDGQQCVLTLNGHTGRVLSATPLPDGRLASCSTDNTIRVWDPGKPDGQQCVATLNGHTSWVESVIALFDGRLASCSTDATIRVWDLAKPDGRQCVAMLIGHTACVLSVTQLPDGRLASGSIDKTINVWSLNQCERGPVSADDEWADIGQSEFII